jgi:chlorophyllide a reductase subunit Z
MRSEVRWESEAQAALDNAVGKFPILTRISATKKLRDDIERYARDFDANAVTLELFDKACQANREAIK